MTTVQRMAPSISTCMRPLPLGSAIPLATGPQKKQKVNASSLPLAMNLWTEMRSCWEEKKELFCWFFLLLECEMSLLWGGPLVQEGDTEKLLLGFGHTPQY